MHLILFEGAAKPVSRHRLLTKGASLTAGLCLAFLSATVNVAAPPQTHAIFKSADRGRSWTRSDQGTSGTARINALGSLDETLFAGTDAGVLSSRDSGQTWQPVPGVAGTSGRILALASLERQVFAASERGLLALTHPESKWSINTAVPWRSARSLLAHGGKLYVGTEGGGVFVSSDTGRTWTPLVRGLPLHAQVFTMVVVQGGLFAGLYSKGLFRWHDSESRWAKTGAVRPLSLAVSGSTLIAGHNPGGIHWSEDLGVTWAQAGSGLPGAFALADPPRSDELSSDAPIWALASDAKVALAGAATGIFYSDDHGHTWSRAREGLPAVCPGVAFLIKDGFALAAALIEGTSAAED